MEFTWRIVAFYNASKILCNKYWGRGGTSNECEWLWLVVLLQVARTKRWLSVWKIKNNNINNMHIKYDIKIFCNDKLPMLLFLTRAWFWCFSCIIMVIYMKSYIPKYNSSRRICFRNIKIIYALKILRSIKFSLYRHFVLVWYFQFPCSCEYLLTRHCQALL